MNKSFALFFLPVGRLMALTAFFLASPLFAQGGDPHDSKQAKKVLIVTSYSSMQPWARHELAGINSALDKLPYPVSIVLTELVVLQNPGLKPQKGSREHLLGSIREAPPDLLIVCDWPAISMLKEDFSKDLAGIPAVLCGLPRREAFDRNTYPNAAVVVQPSCVEENIELGLGLFPNTAEVAIVTDGGIEGVSLNEHLKKKLAGYDRAKLHFLNGGDYSTKEMLDEVGKMPADSFVIFENWRSTDNELLISQESLVRMLSAASKGPILAVVDNESPNILGGIMSQGRRAGAVAGEMAGRIFAGEKPSDLKISAECLKDVFNWEAVNALGINPARLPADTVFYGKPEPFLARHGTLLIFGSFLFAITFAVFAAALFVRNRTAKKFLAEQAAAKEKQMEISERLETTINSIGEAVISTDAGGRIAVFNNIAETLTGYAAADVAGRSFGDVFRFESGGAGIASPISRAMERAENVELAERSDMVLENGRRFPVSANATPIRDAQGNVSGAILVFKDIGEAIRAKERTKSYAEQEQIINECLRLALTNDKSVNVEDGILKIIGEQLGADRCYIFDLNYKEGTSNNTNEWCAEGVKPQIDNLQGVPIDDMSDWVEFFQKDRIIKTHDLANDPSPAFNKLRGMLLAQDIKTLLVGGIWTGGTLWGFVGIDFVRTMHKFTSVDENMIGQAAKIFELYLDRKKSIEILEHSEAEKSIIIESVGWPILLFDENCKLIRINSASARIPGKPIEQILSEPCHVNFCNGLLVGDKCPVRRCMAAGETISFEFSLNGRDYLTSAHPVKNKAGKVINVIETSMDMTEFNEGKRKLEEAAEKAKAADKAKSTFLATMSHEIRTPLNAIIGLSELLGCESDIRADMAESINSINISGRALLSIINDVLELSKIEADKLVVSMEWTDVGKIFDEMRRIFEPQAQSRGIEFVYRVPENLPELYFSPQRLRQVLLNVVGNAMKFTNKGSVSLSLECSLAGNGKAELAIKVGDTGCGIPEKDRQRIFNPFEQSLDKRTSGNAKGTGLGLSIVMRIVEKLGGSISLKSKVGEGSEFAIVFPGVETRAASKTPKDASAAAEIRDWNGEVWVLDDVELNCKVLSMMLQKLGVKSEYMTSARRVLDRVEAGEHPALVMTDMWMPEMNGEEFVRKLHNLENGKGIPAVAVTADTEAQASFSMGVFSGVLLKPVTIAKLEELFGKVQRG